MKAELDLVARLLLEAYLGFGVYRDSFRGVLAARP
jgi:hypothetical protein